MATGRDRSGWRRWGQTPDQPAVAPEEIVGVRANRQHRVQLREVLRGFLNALGDRAAEILRGDQKEIVVFDNHPSVSVLRMLKNAGANIADSVVEQGAEGVDVSKRGGSL